MRISEIYASVQGETQYAGLACTLVRTTGCDLRCGYCDSAFAFYGGRELGNKNHDQEELFNRIVPRPLNKYLSNSIEVFHCPNDDAAPWTMKATWRWTL